MHHKRGFTLIELLVVIAIIGILATIVITQLSSASVKAKNTSSKSEVSQMAKGVELFKNDDSNAGNQVVTVASTTANGNGDFVATLATDCTAGRAYASDTLCNIFNGDLDVAAFTYGTKINKASTANTYTYAVNTGNATKGFAADGNYLVGTTLSTSNGASVDTHYWNLNSSTDSNTTGFPAVP